MRAREFIQEDASAGSTSAGSIAAVAQPLGTVISRRSLSKPTKYANSPKKSIKKINQKDFNFQPR